MTAVAFQGEGPRKTRVFVIEDDPDHQKIAEMTLMSAGISDITVFGTGEEAMDFFEEPPPGVDHANEVILIDLMLPKIGGIEILQRLGKSEKWHNAKKVVLTCSTSPDDRAQCLKFGADAFLSKPLRLEYVEKIISSLD